VSATVVVLPTRGREIVTKKQLAARLGRSERWVELKARDEGLPVFDTDRFGRRRYDAQAVESWLRGAKAKPRRDRVAELEQAIGELRAEVAELRRAS
jgi:hypothetical protein